MDERWANLGQRIVEAAKLAATVHLSRPVDRAHVRNSGQAAAGGAGNACATDGAMPVTTAAVGQPRPRRALALLRGRRWRA